MDSRPECLVPAGSVAADLLGRFLSPEHRREVRELGRVDPEEAVRLSLAASLEAYAYIPSGAETPVFMFGVEPAGLITGTAMVWMLATPDIIRYGARVLRSARWGVARAFRITGAGCLEQYIPQWYETGLRFVRRLGFTATSDRAFVAEYPVVRVSVTRASFDRMRDRAIKRRRAGSKAAAAHGQHKLKDSTWDQ